MWQRDIDHEIQALIRRAYDRAQEILTVHQEKLAEVAAYLMQHETVEGQALIRLFDGPSAQEAAMPEPEPSPEAPPAAKPRARARARHRPIAQPNPTVSIRHDTNPGGDDGGG